MEEDDLLLWLPHRKQLGKNGSTGTFCDQPARFNVKDVIDTHLCPFFFSTSVEYKHLLLLKVCCLQHTQVMMITLLCVNTALCRAPNNTLWQLFGNNAVILPPWRKHQIMSMPMKFWINLTKTRNTLKTSFIQQIKNTKNAFICLWVVDASDSLR